MSWDATLITECCGAERGDWNYTHNTNGMIAEALTDLGCVNAKEIESNHPIWQAIGPAWWQRLDGCSGAIGGEFLSELVRQLESDPAKYRAMDPPNGWGSYDTLLRTLSEMRDASLTEEPTRWRTSG